jgi:CBS-domain-containing membrane protein
MNVAQIMNRNVETCRPTDTLAMAAVKMWDRDVGSLPVLDPDGRVIGAITDRDVCMTACFRGQPLHELTVSTAMSREVYACSPEDALLQAEEIMRGEQLRRLPVVDAEGRICGVITINDLAREAEREELQRRHEITPQEVTLTLATISAPRGSRELASGH